MRNRFISLIIFSLAGLWGMGIFPSHGLQSAWAHPYGTISSHSFQEPVIQGTGEILHNCPLRHNPSMPCPHHRMKSPGHLPGFHIGADCHGKPFAPGLFVSGPDTFANGIRPSNSKNVIVIVGSLEPTGVFYQPVFLASLKKPPRFP